MPRLTPGEIRMVRVLGTVALVVVVFVSKASRGESRRAVQATPVDTTIHYPTAASLPREAPASRAAQDKVTADLIAKDPLIQDATWAPNGYLYVGVDPGSKDAALWPRYAILLCERLKNAYGLHDVPAVRLVNIYDVVRGAGFTEVSKAYCS